MPTPAATTLKVTLSPAGTGVYLSVFLMPRLSAQQAVRITTAAAVAVSEAVEEISSLHEYVIEKYSYKMQYFRCPCGEYSEEALQTLQELGYRTVFWSSAHVDWLTDDQPDPDAALAKLVGQAHGGEILLLHSVSSTNAQILGDLIDALRAKGYTV